MSRAPQGPIPIDPPTIIRLFHRVYYQLGSNQAGGTWDNTFWMGVKTEKNPLDMWIYQEILHKIRPELIIETGTRHGGSAMFLANMCDLLNVGQIITIDVRMPKPAPQHPRITYIHGSSADPQIVQQVHRSAMNKAPVLIILDSDHRADHVLAELRAYHMLVTPGSYLIVEDSNINGRPVLGNFGPGPAEAIEQFMQENSDFEVDQTCEKQLMTFNPGGFLRRKP